jgi:anti-sigma regulatory factor (Ser/Thr protein kinase)
MGAMILIEEQARRAGIQLTVIPPPEPVTELLRITGLADRLEFRPAPGASPALGGSLHGEFIERVEFELAPVAEAPARARAELREGLEGRIEGAELATAILLTSELVTNAVIHASRLDDAPIKVRMAVFEDGVRVEVADSGQGFDPADLAVLAEAPPRELLDPRGGRGLVLVDRCAARWGVQRQPRDLEMPFMVWFELETPGDKEALSA